MLTLDEKIEGLTNAISRSKSDPAATKILESRRADLLALRYPGKYARLQASKGKPVKKMLPFVEFDMVELMSSALSKGDIFSLREGEYTHLFFIGKTQAIVVKASKGNYTTAQVYKSDARQQYKTLASNGCQKIDVNNLMVREIIGKYI